MKFLSSIFCSVLFFSCVPKQPASEIKATTSGEILPWSGIIQYTIENDTDKKIPKNSMKDIKDAIKRINDLGIVSLQETDPNVYSDNKNWITIIYKKNSCNATFKTKPAPGEDPKNSTMVRISSECTTGMIIHELLHSLGLKHEQINPTSDLIIRKERIQTGGEDQYTDPDPIALTEYDPGSIMHYGPYDFSICYNYNDHKWSDPNLKDKLPNEVCRRKDGDFASINPSNGSAIDCRIECAVFLNSENKLIEKQRNDLSAKDIEGLKKLYPKK